VRDVPAVELDALGPAQGGAAEDLRPPRHPGLDQQALALTGVVGRDLVGERRARADERHLARRMLTS
jgi:hypothetical protein